MEEKHDEQGFCPCCQAITNQTVSLWEDTAGKYHHEVTCQKCHTVIEREIYEEV